MYGRGLAALVAVLGVGACLGPNPWFEAGEDETVVDETTGQGDGDGDPSGDGDGDPSGDGDGDPSGDGDGDPCMNGVQDGDETDLDCGGSCSPCAAEQDCLIDQDCASAICEAGSCAAPSCSDGITNGDELETDCGGSCRFCEHSALVAKLSGTTESALFGVDTAMFDDGGFAITYVDPDLGVQVRWFDQYAFAKGSAVHAVPEISDSNFYTLSLRAGSARADDLVHLALNGTDAMSTNVDSFAATLDPSELLGRQPIYQGDIAVNESALDVDDELAALVWNLGGIIRLRHYDYAMAVDLGAPQTANPEFGLRPAKHPTVATRDGLTVVAWSACDPIETKQCDIELRRYDGGWLDNSPVVLGLPLGNYLTSRVAIAADGRVALTTWRRDENQVPHTYAAMFGADFNLEGWWLLQGNLGSTFTPSPVVVALSDGSFAMAWSDADDQRVHLRRYIGADVPLVDDVGDEAPWPASAPNPGWVGLATHGNLLVAAWTATNADHYVVQGQVLSF